MTPTNANAEVLEEITQHFNQLTTTHNRNIDDDDNANTPPPSPAEYNIEKEANCVLVKGSEPLKGRLDIRYVVCL